MKNLILALALCAGAAHATTPLCDRTPEIRDNVAAQLKKACAQVTDTDLATIKRIAVPDKKIKALRADDFDGMSALEIVNVVRNEIKTLPAGIFANQPKLKTLVLFDNPITELPPDFLADNPNLENLHFFSVPLRSLGTAVVQRISALQHVKVIDLSTFVDPTEQAQLRTSFPFGGKVELTFYEPTPDQFIPVCVREKNVQQFLITTLKKTCDQIMPADLAKVKRIAVQRRKVPVISPSDLQGMPNLEILNIKMNEIVSFPQGYLSQFPKLKTLVILGNPLTALPADFFAYTPELENLHMFRVKISTLPESIYRQLGAMKKLKVLDIGKSLSQADQDRFRKLFPENGNVELNFYP